ncbi:MAG TPA: MaoC family dehydratase [Microlunatus sp.]
MAEVAVGDQLPTFSARLTRETLVRYAGASGDFNPIHYSDYQATRLGLPGVIAHGMLTMALSLRAVTDWAGDPARVTGCFTRFTRPVPVPDDDAGAELTVGGKVSKIENGTATVQLDVRCGEEKVLGMATAEVLIGEQS